MKKYITLLLIFFSSYGFSESGFIQSINSKCKVWDDAIDTKQKVIFQGDCDNSTNLPNGKGEAAWIVGDPPKIQIYFKGNFKNGKMEGYGEYESWDNGRLTSVSKGEFHQNQLNGKGEYKTQDGVASGIFINWNLIEGVLLSKNGTMYSGNFINGKLSGEGQIKFPDGGTMIGQYQNGKLNGLGKVTYSNGLVGEGVFENGKIVKILMVDAPWVHKAYPTYPTFYSPPQPIISSQTPITQLQPGLLNNNQSMTIITPHGRAIDGFSWSTQQPGTINGGTFFMPNK